MKRLLTPSQMKREGKKKKALEIFKQCMDSGIDENEAYRIIAQKICVCRNTAKTYIEMQQV